MRIKFSIANWTSTWEEKRKEKSNLILGDFETTFVGCWLSIHRKKNHFFIDRMFGHLIRFDDSTWWWESSDKMWHSHTISKSLIEKMIFIYRVKWRAVVGWAEEYNSSSLIVNILTNHSLISDETERWASLRIQVKFWEWEMNRENLGMIMMMMERDDDINSHLHFPPHAFRSWFNQQQPIIVRKD